MTEGQNKLGEKGEGALGIEDIQLTQVDKNQKIGGGCGECPARHPRKTTHHNKVAHTGGWGAGQSPLLQGEL